MRRILSSIMVIGFAFFLYGCGGGNGGGGLTAPAALNSTESNGIFAASYESALPALFVMSWGGRGSGDGLFTGPVYDLAADGEGNVYVSDAGSGRVLRFTETGIFVSSWQTGGCSPAGLAVDGDGNIYVVCGGSKIEKRSKEGVLLKSWGSAGTGDGEFSGAMDVAVDEAGFVYVADSGNSRVQKFDKDGNFVLAFAAGGPAGDGNGNGLQSRPIYVAVDKAGDIYAGDENNNISKYDAQGNFLLSWGGKGIDDGKFGGIGGLAVSAAGNIYVVDTGNRRTQKFTSDGVFISKWTIGNGEEDGALAAGELPTSPAGIAVSSRGDIYVADGANCKINKYGYPRGAAAVVATCTVTSDSDSGAGSLRECINQANTNPAADTILFSNSLIGRTIQLASSLPPLTNNATAIINATGGEVTISGSVEANICFTIQSANNEIRGLTIVSCYKTSGGLTGEGGAVLITGASAANNIIAGNFIGTNAASSNDNVLKNYSGVTISAGANHNTIGGVNQGDRNIISNNIGPCGGAVFIYGDGSNFNEVIGNYVGVDVSGTAALPNFAGISIEDGADENIIGGATPNERNVISGNSSFAVYVRISKKNVIIGNYIGTNATGDAAIGNSASSDWGAVILDASSDGTRVGGTTPGERNVISGNRGAGTLKTPGISTREASYLNKIIGNYIGTNAAGTAAIGNDIGIFMASDYPNYVGGTAAGEGNVISGNSEDGIMLKSQRISSVFGNYIGSNSSGAGPLPNGKNGIHILYRGTGTFISISNNIGGVAAGQANLIAYNLGAGVFIEHASSDGNKISGNKIYSNFGLGIDLAGDGANNNIAAPVISTAVANGANYNISGTAVCPGFPCTVELYRVNDSVAGVSPDPLGAGEGFEYLASATIASGSAFSFLNIPISANGTKVTATITDKNGNTSEFAKNKALSTLVVSPVVSACAFSPASIPANGTTTTSLQCTVTDANGVSSVTANLTELGGSNTAALTRVSGNIFRITGLTAQASLAVKQYKITIVGTDTTGDTGSATALLTVTNALPVVSACTATPSSVPPDGTIQVKLSCTASDANGTISSVNVNLAPIGGKASWPFVLNNTSGNIWEKTGQIVLKKTPGTYTLTITAKDNLNGLGTSTVALTVLNEAPVFSTSCAFLPSSVPADGKTIATLSCGVTDSNENLSTVAANLTGLRGLASTPLTKTSTNTWTRTGVVVPIGVTPGTYNVTTTAKDASGATSVSTAPLTVSTPISAAPVILSCAFTPPSIVANGTASTTLKCTITDVNSDLSSASVNLDPIGGSASAALMRSTGDTWQLLGITANPTKVPYAYNLHVTAADTAGNVSSTFFAKLTLTNAPPTISGCSFSPSAISPDGIASTTLQCTASDVNGQNPYVTANLSGIGGAATKYLTNIGGNTWRATGITVYGKLPAAYNIKITAKDPYLATASAVASLTVSNLPPRINSCTISPNSRAADGVSTFSIYCSVSDLNDNVSSVIANLSAVGGLAATQLVKDYYGAWNKTGLKVPVGINPNTYNITITAKDSSAASVSTTVPFTVTAPPATAPSLSACAFSPNPVVADGVAATTLKCTVIDVNQNISTVKANLSGIGGASDAALVKSTGNIWQLTGIKTTASATLLYYVTQAAVGIPVTANDTTSLSSSTTVSLSVKNVAPKLTNCAFSPNLIRANGTATTTLQCTATDVNGNLTNVTANLSALRGQTAQALTGSGNGTWTQTGINAPAGTVPKTYSFSIKATDTSTASTTVTASLIVTAP